MFSKKDLSNPTINDICDLIDSDIAHIKSLQNKLLDAFTTHPDKKEEFKAILRNLNEILEVVEEIEREAQSLLINGDLDKNSFD